MIFSLSLPTRLASSLQISLHASLIVHFDTQGYVLFVIYVKKIKSFLNIHFLLYKHNVHKHTQPQILEILSTLLSTPPASDFEIHHIIFEKIQIFSKILKC